MEEIRESVTESYIGNSVFNKMGILTRIIQLIEPSLSSGPSIGTENYNTYELAALNFKNRQNQLILQLMTK